MKKKLHGLLKNKWKKWNGAPIEMRDLALPSKKGLEKKERNDMPPTCIVPLPKIIKGIEPPPTLHNLNPKKKDPIPMLC